MLGIRREAICVLLADALISDDKGKICIEITAAVFAVGSVAGKALIVYLFQTVRLPGEIILIFGRHVLVELAVIFRRLQLGKRLDQRLAGILHSGLLGAGRFVHAPPPLHRVDLSVAVTDLILHFHHFACGGHQRLNAAFKGISRGFRIAHQLRQLAVGDIVDGFARIILFRTRVDLRELSSVFLELPIPEFHTVFHNEQLIGLEPLRIDHVAHQDFIDLAVGFLIILQIVEHLRRGIFAEAELLSLVIVAHQGAVGLEGGAQQLSLSLVIFAFLIHQRLVLFYLGDAL